VTALAIAFAWGFGLSDRQTAAALGLTENGVRKRRRKLGLIKTGRGAPVWERDA
jgi:hypothetical protein